MELNFKKIATGDLARVDAIATLDVATVEGEQDRTTLTLHDGSTYQPHPVLLQRYTPGPGDFLVRQQDGLDYAIPNASLALEFTAI